VSKVIKSYLTELKHIIIYPSIMLYNCFGEKIDHYKLKHHYQTKLKQYVYHNVPVNNKLFGEKSFYCVYVILFKSETLLYGNMSIS